MTEEEIVAVAIHNGLYPHQQIGGFAGMHGSQQYTLFQAARAAIEALDKHRAEKALDEPTGPDDHEFFKRQAEAYKRQGFGR